MEKGGYRPKAMWEGEPDWVDQGACTTVCSLGHFLGSFVSRNICIIIVIRHKRKFSHIERKGGDRDQECSHSCLTGTEIKYMYNYMSRVLLVQTRKKGWFDERKNGYLRGLKGSGVRIFASIHVARWAVCCT